MPKYNKTTPETVVPASSEEVEIFQAVLDYSGNKIRIKATGRHGVVIEYADMPAGMKTWFDTSLERAEAIMGLTPADRID